MSEGIHGEYQYTVVGIQCIIFLLKMTFQRRSMLLQMHVLKQRSTGTLVIKEVAETMKRYKQK
jgi:hypothetical protein